MYTKMWTHFFPLSLSLSLSIWFAAYVFSMSDLPHVTFSNNYTQFRFPIKSYLIGLEHEEIVFADLWNVYCKQILARSKGQIDRQRDRETERQRDRETERQRDKETERQRDRETTRQRDRETERQLDKEKERQIDRKTEWQRDQKTERQLDKETEDIDIKRQREKYRKTDLIFCLNRK